MKKKVCSAVALTCVCLGLFFGLTAALLGVSYAGVRVVPDRAPEVYAVGETAGDADSLYWLMVEKDPEEIYRLARRQTVRITWDKKDAEGNTTSNIAGTGIIASSDGYILTNSHVVIDAKNAGEPVQVELFDGTVYEGVILGADPETEVALLKVEAQWLSAATLGSSRQLQPCQTVYTMGHPSEDLKYTMTSGIISGLDRTIGFGDGTELHMFQFDAPVNPGNSGGPVYDNRGTVIGIVTAKYVDITSEGIGFALPIEDVLPVAEELKEKGYVSGRPLLGIVVQTAEADQFLKGSPAGAVIHSVEPGLAGDRAGLRKGDVLTELGGKPVTDLDSLTAAKRGFRAGDTVTIRFWRAGETLETELTFDEVTPEHPVGPVSLDEPEKAPETEEPESPPEPGNPETPEPGPDSGA